MTAWKDLETLREAHRQAARGVGRIEGEMRSSRRVPERARAELAVYFEAVAAQEREPDHELESACGKVPARPISGSRSGRCSPGGR